MEGFTCIVSIDSHPVMLGPCSRVSIRIFTGDMSCSPLIVVVLDYEGYRRSRHFQLINDDPSVL